MAKPGQRGISPILRRHSRAERTTLLHRERDPFPESTSVLVDVWLPYTSPNSKAVGLLDTIVPRSNDVTKSSEESLRGSGIIIT